MVREQNAKISGPVETGLPESLLGNAANEFIERRARGETPSITEYEEKYPEIAGAIRDIFPALDLIGNSASGASPRSERDSIGPSRRLGDFQILGELGRGGMGVVYEAEQISMGRRVALKVLPLAVLVDEMKIRRFHNEVRAVAALDHPNIVSVYMVGEDRGVHYFAMQLIRGRNLAEVIDSLRASREEGETLTAESLSQIAEGQPSAGSKPLSAEDPTAAYNSAPAPDENAVETVACAHNTTIAHGSRREYFRNVAAIGVQAARAIQHAHEQGVIHRDIKPANLLLDKSAHLYVTDFGLARMEADVGATMTGDLIGTLRYMSPEQALANRVDVDHRADIYSLAVTLYELLTLRPAYPAQNRQQLLKQIAFEEPVALRRLDAEIPTDLETIVHKAMSKDRDERYTSVEAMAADLGRFLEDRAIQAKPPSLPQLVNKWARRNPVLVWATIVTMLLATLSSAVITLQVAKQRDTARQATQQLEDQLKVSTVTRLASDSRATRWEQPDLSVLLAVEAMKLAQRSDAALLPIAHEALLNSTQELRGAQPLSGSEVSISHIATTSQWIITLAASGSVQLWDVDAPQPASSCRQLQADDNISSMTVSGDGRWLVTAGQKLQRWDLHARYPEAASHRFSDCDQTVTGLNLSEDGRLLGETRIDGTSRLWQLGSDGRNTTSMVKEFSGRVEVSPDGKWVANAPENQPTIQLWKTEAGGVSATPRLLSGHTDRVPQMAFSPNSQWIASQGQDVTVRLWDLTADDPTTPTLLPAGDHEPIDSLQFSKDSTQLVARGYYSCQVLHWSMSVPDIASSKVTLQGHTDAVTDVTTSHDGRWLISSSLDGTVRFWNIKDLSTEPTIIKAHDSVFRVVIHPEGRWLVTTDKELARLWDLHGGDPSSTSFVLHGQDRDIFSASAISLTGRWIATSDETAIQLWEPDARDPKHFSRQLETNSLIRSIEISADDRWLVAGCRDGTGHVFSLSANDVESSHEVFHPNNAVSSGSEASSINYHGVVTISSNSQWVALGCADNNIRMWDLTADHGNRSPRIFQGNTSPIRSVVISPDGRWLASASESLGVLLWNLENNAAEPSFTFAERTWNSIAFDANSRWLATSSSLWDLRADDPMKAPRVIGPDDAEWGLGVWRLALSPDARWLFTCRPNRTSQLWDLRGDDPKRIELRLPTGVYDAAISSDGHWLAAGCGLNGYLWDLTAADPAKSQRILRGHTDKIWSVRISKDSRWLITDSSDGTIRRWNLDSPWLLDRARAVTVRELTNEEKRFYGIQELDGVGD